MKCINNFVKGAAVIGGLALALSVGACGSDGGGHKRYSPKIISEPVMEVNEGGDYSYCPEATDKNKKDKLKFSLTESPEWLSLDSDNCVVGVSPLVDADTDYGVSLKVSDGKKTDTESYAVTVRNIPDPV